MILGTWGDIEESESRVICTPVEVESINSAGRDVWVQYDCGKMAAYQGEKYAATVACAENYIKFEK